MQNWLQDKNCIRGHRLNEVNELAQEKRLFDFIPGVMSTKVSHLEILLSWERFLKTKDIPYAVIQTGKRVALWKEKLVGD